MAPCPTLIGLKRIAEQSITDPVSIAAGAVLWSYVTAFEPMTAFERAAHSQSVLPAGSTAVDRAAAAALAMLCHAAREEAAKLASGFPRFVITMPEAA